MGTLFFVCPTTGRAVSTGVEIDPSSYSSLPSRTRLRCPRCDEIHSLSGVRSWLAGEPAFEEALTDIWAVLYGRFPEAPAKELSASLNQLLSALAASGITDPKELRHRAIEELVPRTAGRIA
jgi:hypothetical protein